jgi:hypothetical protein
MRSIRACSAPGSRGCGAAHAIMVRDHRRPLRQGEETGVASSATQPICAPRLSDTPATIAPWARVSRAAGGPGTSAAPSGRRERGVTMISMPREYFASAIVVLATGSPPHRAGPEIRAHFLAPGVRPEWLASVSRKLSTGSGRPAIFRIVRRFPHPRRCVPHDVDEVPSPIGYPHRLEGTPGASIDATHEPLVPRGRWSIRLVVVRVLVQSGMHLQPNSGKGG